MKIWICTVLLVLMSGCIEFTMQDTDQDPNTPPVPVVNVDPNQVGSTVAAVESVGQTTTAIGTAFGHPEIAGIGILITTIAGAVGGALLKGRKK